MGNKVALDVINTNTLMLGMYTSRLDTSFVSKKDLMEIEQHILVNMGEFMKTDLSMVIASFLRLNYNPEKLFKEIS